MYNFEFEFAFILTLLMVQMCNIVEKLLLLKIGPLDLLIFPKSGSGIR